MRLFVCFSSGVFVVLSLSNVNLVDVSCRHVFLDGLLYPMRLFMTLFSWFVAFLCGVVFDAANEAGLMLLDGCDRHGQHG